MQLVQLDTLSHERDKAIKALGRLKSKTSPRYRAALHRAKRVRVQMAKVIREIPYTPYQREHLARLLTKAHERVMGLNRRRRRLEEQSKTTRSDQRKKNYQRQLREVRREIAEFENTVGVPVQLVLGYEYSR